MLPFEIMADPTPSHILQSLSGKTVLITGASAGIGWHTALAFARHGANLVLTARRADRLEALVKEIEALGAMAVFHAGDAADNAVAEATVALALKSFSRLDILINNAGAGNYKQLVDTSVEEYDQLMNSNMKSTFLFTRHAAPAMIAQKSGTIVLISSIAGLQGYANEAVYSATKFAQVGFGQALEAELRPHGIKVETICPGGVKTEFALGHGRTEEYVRDSYMMDPAEFAETIVFACRQPANLRIVQMTVRHMGEPPKK
jgi:NADP-dependent 3-hydroxy acid dehydrogenase YdfG